MLHQRAYYIAIGRNSLIDDDLFIEKLIHELDEKILAESTTVEPWMEVTEGEDKMMFLASVARISAVD